MTRHRLGRARGCAVLAVVLALVGPRSAWAQARPIWTLSTSYRQIHNSNLIPYIANGPADVIDSPSLSLSYLRPGPTGSLSLSASGFGTLFHENTQFNRFGFTLSLGANRQLSRRTKLGLSASSTSGLSAESLYLTRVLFPQVSVSSRQGAAHLSHEASRTTTITLDANASISRFRADVPVAAAFTVDPSLVEPVPFPALVAPLEPPVFDASLLALSVLASEGAAAGESEFRLLGAGIGITRAFSPVLHGTGWLRFSQVHLETGALTEGGRKDASLALSRSFGPSTRITVSYTYEQNQAQVPNLSTSAVVVQFETSLAGVKFETSAGFSDLGSGLANRGTSVGSTPLGGLGLSHRGRRSSAYVRYNRTVFEAFGVGRNEITDYGSAGVSRTLNKRMSAHLDGSYRRSRDPFDTQFEITTKSVSTGLSYRFKERTRLGLDYSAVNWTTLGAAPIDSSVWSVFISYGRSYR